MTEQEILSLRDHGEVTKVQFKERIVDAYDAGCCYRNCKTSRNQSDGNWRGNGATPKKV